MRKHHVTSSEVVSGRDSVSRAIDAGVAQLHSPPEKGGMALRHITYRY